MYLASLHVTLDLDPEVARTDRERVLRALRDKVKQVHGSRVSVRTDDDSAVVVALLDDNLERAKARLEEITELLDDAGQARILTSTGQVFAWFEGRFQETADSKAESGDEDDLAGGRGLGTFGNGLGMRAGFTPKERPERTIVYADEDEDDFNRSPGPNGRPLAPTSQGLGRRGLRIPTRK
jgi:hypothetical protein